MNGRNYDFRTQIPELTEKKDWAYVWGDDDSDDDEAGVYHDPDKGAVYGSLRNKYSKKEDQWRWPSPDRNERKKSPGQRNPTFQNKNSNRATERYKSRRSVGWDN